MRPTLASEETCLLIGTEDGKNIWLSSIRVWVLSQLVDPVSPSHVPLHLQDFRYPPPSVLFLNPKTLDPLLHSLSLLTSKALDLSSSPWPLSVLTRVSQSWKELGHLILLDLVSQHREANIGPRLRFLAENVMLTPFDWLCRGSFLGREARERTRGS